MNEGQESIGCPEIEILHTYQHFSFLEYPKALILCPTNMMRISGEEGRKDRRDSGIYSEV